MVTPILRESFELRHGKQHGNSAKNGNVLLMKKQLNLVMFYTTGLHYLRIFVHTHSIFGTNEHGACAHIHNFNANTLNNNICLCSFFCEQVREIE